MKQIWFDTHFESYYLFVLVSFDEPVNPCVILSSPFLHTRREISLSNLKSGLTRTSGSFRSLDWSLLKMTIESFTFQSAKLTRFKRARANEAFYVGAVILTYDEQGGQREKIQKWKPKSGGIEYLGDRQDPSQRSQCIAFVYHLVCRYYLLLIVYITRCRICKIRG